MMASSKSKSNITPEKLQSSISPSRTFYNSSTVSSSSSMARSLTPNRSTSVDRYGYISSSPSVSSSIDHRNNASSSPGRNSIASSSIRERNQTSSNHRNSNNSWSNGQKKTCMCSPTTHPGSFRCSLHRNGNQINNAVSISYHSHRSYSNRRSGTTNSLMRIRTEGDLVKRYLASLIRPSSNQQKRPVDFQPKPSRLSVMSKSDE